MADYSGEKFEIELENFYDTPQGGADNAPARLWRVRGFNTLVFDEAGIKKLRKMNHRINEAEIGSVAPGTTVSVGGIEWDVLDTDFQGGVFVLAKQPICNKEFDEDNNNDWKESSAREYLNGEWAERLKTLIGTLIEFERDLTSDDGLKTYGGCLDEVSLISCDEYRRYRKFITNKNDWWWTLTAWSTSETGNSHYVRFVNTYGSLYNYDAYYGHFGLAPACVPPSSLKVEISRDGSGEDDA